MRSSELDVQLRAYFRSMVIRIQQILILVHIQTNNLMKRKEFNTYVANHERRSDVLDKGSGRSSSRPHGNSEALLTQYHEPEPEPRNTDEQTACNSETRHSGRVDDLRSVLQPLVCG